ncbi:type II toxin-antitoxin system RelE/ParE family toxin [Bacillus pacificus]|uniref:type II toxin-antitoxin system RelE/ParE family toxin n=1 Tax=Bacillus pacificus TaxID=2026187 RepID=UPI003D6526FD
MGNKRIVQYPNLVFVTAVLRMLNAPSEEAKRKMLESFRLLNDNGTNDEYLQGRIEKTHRGDIWEMKFKDKSKTEWRILFKKISHKTNPPQYALLHMFRKTTKAITKRDLDTAERVAKREGF